MVRQEIEALWDQIVAMGTLNPTAVEEPEDLSPQLDGEREQQGAYSFHGTSRCRVSSTWRFPRGGMYSIWKQWWLGDSVKGVPPLCMLDARDMEFLDYAALTWDEMHG
mmetsp:Transcript_20614/g.44607  ORF Transcript_20614/g.44607 Transcript_20614/m.44607 type:complete len:108 (-) Transcript_20614:172-495(-)